MENQFVFFTDGATEGWNGKLGTVKFCGIGFHCPDDGYQYSERIEAGSNNEAEFYALIAAMKYALAKGYESVEFRSDSMIVVRRAKGLRPRGKGNERMDNFQDDVLHLAEEFTTCEFIWIPREENGLADYLSTYHLRK